MNTQRQHRSDSSILTIKREWLLMPITILILWLIPVSFFAQIASTVFGEVMVRTNNEITTSDIEKAVSDEFGFTVAFKRKSTVSEYMDIELFGFDENVISKKELIHFLRNLNGVRAAQANHIIEERTIPDDPFFGQQWHHQQAEDHDIDSELAWDITTGGLTTTGDEIVVCVVELGGAKWNTADIADNHWVNENEIPDNSIDDDGNGYIDDYDGWNINDDDDNISEGDHGTRVSSMIGAKGNNASGVTGVNWDVKLMQVEIGSSNEASAIAGYTYPLVMRKLYNESNGALGAFVVATNSSWGTNNGQPEDAPLWCAMYDSLGVHGVLSCGSTTNSNADVDVVGDLPTACPSDFLISVGRTNNQDIRASGGYGLTTIDLMAPGDNVYLANNTNYGTTTGTSFSGPCVAGAIALLYSAPCNSLMQFITLNPGGSALLFKDYVLDGVDPTTQLQSETVSGGRLNVNNSLQLLMLECDNSTCIPPFSLTATQIGNSLDYMIIWDVLQGIENYQMQYRLSTEQDWIIINDISTGVSIINDLTPCAEYELQVRSICGAEESEWSDIFSFTTDGCCTHPIDFHTISASDTTVTISWEYILAASSYNILLSSESAGDWLIENVADTSFVIDNLIPCTNYDVTILSNCINAQNDSSTFSVHTGGCDECSDLQYCEVSTNSASEHIQQVILGDINRISADDSGYILVTETTTTLVAGEEYIITCVPGYSGQSYNENFIAWIDFNSDGDFSELNELVFDAPTATTVSISGNITIPENITNGVVRLRVAMRYTPPNSNNEPTECGEWSYGEVEDYCVTLASTVGYGDAQELSAELYPNPADNIITIDFNDSSLNGKISFSIYNATGQLVHSSVTSNIGRLDFDITTYNPGLYYMRLQSGDLTKSIRFIKR